MEYQLYPFGLEHNPRIIIVGVGGTGGYVAEAVCRLLTGSTGDLILVDHDRVEAHNLLRQNFYPGEVGRYKSRALAERLARQYDRTVGYVTTPFAADWRPAYPGFNERQATLLIGCVDNAAARAELAHANTTTRVAWTIDAGNGRNWGQILIGNSLYRHPTETAFKEQTCYRLPLPTVQRPDLLTPAPADTPDRDCAAAIALQDQDATINLVMAALVTQTVQRIITGTCPFMSLYLDLETGTLTPTYATPDHAAQGY